MTSQSQIPTMNHDPADKEVAHPQGEGEEGGGEVEEGREEAVDQEVELVLH